MFSNPYRFWTSLRYAADFTCLSEADGQQSVSMIRYRKKNYKNYLSILHNSFLIYMIVEYESLCISFFILYYWLPSTFNFNHLAWDLLCFVHSLFVIFLILVIVLSLYSDFIVLLFLLFYSLFLVLMRFWLRWISPDIYWQALV